MAKEGRTPRGNPRINEVNQATRFGQPRGADPVAAGRKRRKGVRAAVRAFAEMQIDLGKVARDGENVAAAVEAAIVAYALKSKEDLTVADRIAIKKIAAAMAGNVAALENITNDIDGKQVDRVAQTTVTLADLVNGCHGDDGDDS